MESEECVHSMCDFCRTIHTRGALECIHQHKELMTSTGYGVLLRTTTLHFLLFPRYLPRSCINLLRVSTLWAGPTLVCTARSFMTRKSLLISSVRPVMWHSSGIRRIGPSIPRRWSCTQRTGGWIHVPHAHTHTQTCTYTQKT